MTVKTQQALLGAALMSMLVTGCGIVIDARPWHLFGAALFAATLCFTMDYFDTGEK